MGLYRTAARSQDREESPNTSGASRSTVACNPRLEQSKRCEQKRLSTKEERCPSGQSSWKHEGATAKSLPMCKAVPTARRECRSRSTATSIPDKWPPSSARGRQNSAYRYKHMRSPRPKGGAFLFGGERVRRAAFSIHLPYLIRRQRLAE